MEHSFISMLDLQLFADGGAGDGGASGGESGAGAGVTAAAAVPQTKAEKNNPLANVKYGVQPEAAPVAEEQPAAEETPAEEAQPDLNAEFDALIKGKYKDQYDSRMQNTIRQRLAGPSKDAQAYKALTPALEHLAKQLNVDPADSAALAQAILDNGRDYAAESLETGIPEDQLRRMDQMKRENEQYKRQEAERQKQEAARAQYIGWMQQAEAAKQQYPNLDLNAELENPQFVQLLKSNIDVGNAYLIVHKDELFSGAMVHTAKQVESKIAKQIASGSKRPTENGIGSTGAALVKDDVTKLTKADRAEIAKRVARGERIVF